MQQIKPALNSLAARLLLQSAIATVRLMRWLYKWRLINWDDTDRFLEAAKKLEGFADKFGKHTIRRR